MPTRNSNAMRKRALRVATIVAVFAGVWYLRHIDFPATDGSDELRAIVGFTEDARDVYYYRSRNFMDTWYLFRARVRAGEVDAYVDRTGLAASGEVEYFDLIISRPPPYWWHPERLPHARLYEGSDADGRSITVMHSTDQSLAYFLVY